MHDKRWLLIKLAVRVLLRPTVRAVNEEMNRKVPEGHVSRDSGFEPRSHNAGGGRCLFI